jgi:protein-L-isoaspartate(D-aspartate) O-methyltransferase
VANQRRHGDLEIDADDEFQRREWLAERVGWLVLGLLLLGGLLGAFGEGWLSQTSTPTVGDRFRVDYERVARHGSPATMRVALMPGAVPTGVALIWVDRAYLEGVDLRGIAPQPDASWLARDRVVYAVRIQNPADSAHVTFDIQPDNYWSRHARVGLDGGPSVAFDQLVLP